MDTMASPNHQPHDCSLNQFKVQIKGNIKAPCHWPLCGSSGNHLLPDATKPLPEPVVLSWHVQNFIVITSLQLGLEENYISIEFNFQQQNCHWNEPQTSVPIWIPYTHTSPTFGHSFWQLIKHHCGRQAMTWHQTDSKADLSSSSNFLKGPITYNCCFP